MVLRSLHRFSAFALLGFLVVHIANHLVSLLGIPNHIAFMEIARVVYRNPFVESALLLCAGFQVMSGLRLVIRGWRGRSGVIGWLQAISGLYLAFFMLVHVSAVLYGRTVLNLDTNFYFAAAGIHVPPYHYFFIPYYYLAVFALSAHVGCALYWLAQSLSEPVRRALVVVLLLKGGIVSAVITLSLAGYLQPVDIPDRYKATYAKVAV